MANRIGIEVQGLKPTLRAFKQLEDGAQAEMQEAAQNLMRELATLVQAAGRSEGRQARVAANTVEVYQRGKLPSLRAGAKGSKRDRAVTLGSEFGATRRFGWYAKGRYYDSVGKQFRPHRGAASYWFFTTVEKNDARIGAAYEKALDRIAEKWGRG